MKLKPSELTLLEYLAQGMRTKEIARELNLTDDTVRQYLTTLYRRLDLKNAKKAVAWYLNTYRPNQPQAAPQGAPQAALPAAPEAAADSETLAPQSLYPGPRAATLPHAASVETDPAAFGAIAHRHGLLAALGALHFFLSGPKGAPWHWLLAGDIDSAIAYTRTYTQTPQSPQNAATPLLTTADCSLLAALLYLHGHRDAAAAWAAQAAPEHQPLLTTLQGGIHHAHTWATLHQIANQPHEYSDTKHLAMLLMFHHYRLMGDQARSHASAEAILQEALAVKNYINGRMAPFYSNAIIPKPIKSRKTSHL